MIQSPLYSIPENFDYAEITSIYKVSPNKNFNYFFVLIEFISVVGLDLISDIKLYLNNEILITLTRKFITQLDR